MRMVRKRIAAAMAALALTGALAACGGKNENAAEQETAVASQDLVIRATNWQFDKAEYTVPKDTPIRYMLENEQGAHGVEIEKAGVKLSNGKKSKVATLAAGTYTIKCNIVCGQGHLAMKATLIVK
ncbi:cupredoxin domain-containing protein [Cohnella hashimotonis]|uniref:Cupredoxin domain-containing protein n=1 Tax=Cohnella hashimotonis TaxID=2826895 RepID=A0ABT6TCS5_9BACL|nr:cupredoxin domain-containing protein [Cohnella hashimotonis]MDI4644627.1 cupredoxin domain-containing protein [Cohnella hashimotonis]